MDIYIKTNLEYLLKLKRIKKIDLAEYLDVDPSTIGSYVSGRSYPSLPKILEICKYFKLSPNDLLLKDLQSIDDDNPIILAEPVVRYTGNESQLSINERIKAIENSLLNMQRSIIITP